MPLYEYLRKDGSKFEITQKITDSALTKCPTTGQDCTRIISVTAPPQFKGKGFYQTDYKKR
jgi:putative FmdB family regulatory protein